jgi:hypothetical protein
MTPTNPAMDLTQAEMRLPRWMLALAAAGTLGILLSLHVGLGMGFAVGAGLGILNYLWLHQAVAALMSGGQSRPSKAVLAKMLLRYPLAFGVIYLFYVTGWLPFQAILAGLFVPLGGALIESIALIREGLKAPAGLGDSRH